MCLFLGRFLHVHVHVDTHDGSRRVGHSNKIRETLDKTLDGVRFEQSSCVVGVCWVVGRWSSGKLKTSMAWDSDKAAALLFVGFPQRGRVRAGPDEADQNKSAAKNNQQQQFRRRSDQLHQCCIKSTNNASDAKTVNDTFDAKHRKNCECCPGHYLIVRWLSVIVN